MFGIDDLALGALSFGGSLLSGIGAGQSASKANKRAANLQAWTDAMNAATGDEMIRRYDGRHLVQDAQEAGFNPVTYLGAMGPSYGAITAQGWGMKTRNVPAQQAVPSTLSAIGGALSAGVSSLQSSLSDNKKIAAQQANVAAYLSSVQTARAKGNPMAGLGTAAFSMAGPRITRARTGALSVGGIEATDTGLLPAIDTSNPDASAVQKRYDALVSMPVGVGNYIADAWRSYYNARGADPSKDYGFGTRFAPNTANDRLPPSSGWWPTGSLSPYRAPSGPQPGSAEWEQAVNPPLFGW